MLKFRRLLYLLFVLTGCAHATELLRDMDEIAHTFNRVYGPNGRDKFLMGLKLDGYEEITKKVLDLFTKYPEIADTSLFKDSMRDSVDRMRKLGRLRDAEDEEFAMGLVENPGLYKNPEFLNLLKSNDNSIKNDIALRKLVLPHKPAPIAPEIDFFQSWNRDTKHAFPKMDSLLETHPKKTVFSKKKVSKSKKSKSSVKASASKRRKTKRSRSRGKKMELHSKKSLKKAGHAAVSKKKTHRSHRGKNTRRHRRASKR